jgi:hypothetical protein
MLHNVIGEMRISHTVSFLMKREVLLGGLYNYIPPPQQSSCTLTRYTILFSFCIAVCSDISYHFYDY